MSSAEGPIAPWAFRAALSGLPEGEVRDILESDRCPQPEAPRDPTVFVEDDTGAIIRRPDETETWLRAVSTVDLESVR